MSLKFVLNGPIDNIPALVQIMAWRRTCDKLLPEPMITQFSDAYGDGTGVGVGVGWWGVGWGVVVVGVVDVVVVGVGGGGFLDVTCFHPWLIHVAAASQHIEHKIGVIISNMIHVAAASQHIEHKIGVIISNMYPMWVPYWTFIDTVVRASC